LCHGFRRWEILVPADTSLPLLRRLSFNDSGRLLWHIGC